MRYDPLEIQQEIAAAAMFIISATEQPWEQKKFAFFWAGGWEGNGIGVGGGGGGRNHLIFRRIEGVIIRNWEPKKEIIEEELEELNSEG